MIALSEFMKKAEGKSESERTATDKMVLAAFWAGEEHGRGRAMRDQLKSIEEKKSSLPKTRYWKIQQKALACADLSHSVNDDSPEILSWDFPEAA